MINASVWAKNRIDVVTYENVRLTPHGVLLPHGTVAAEEVLIPWHRVHEAYATVPGEIELATG